VPVDVLPVDVFLVFAKARAAASVKVDFILQLAMEKFNLTNPEAPKKEKVILNKYERKLNDKKLGKPTKPPS